MPREGPPSRAEVTTSRTWPDSVEVKILTSSGMIAPASVPQVMTVESFHQSVPSPRSRMSSQDAKYVSSTETIDVSHTNDERGAGDAVRLEPVGARPDRVARVVAGAVGDDAGVPRVVLLDVEDDLHEVRPDVGDLGEDAAGDAQRGGAQRLADGEPDEARARVVAGQGQQDAEHDHQLDADEQHADAHA